MNKKIASIVVIILLFVGFTIAPATSGSSACLIKEIKKTNLDNKYPILNNNSGTVFRPPYEDCYSWGEGTNIIDEHNEGANNYSGAIGVYVNALLGGATSEALQIKKLYVGREKTLTVEANILYLGGTIEFGIAEFVGTQKVWRIDVWDNYHRKDIKKWLTWEIVISKIIDIVSLAAPGIEIKNIKEAIEVINTIKDFYTLYNALVELYNAGEAKLARIEFEFMPSKGVHTLWMGLRATASACLTGTASAVMMGQVVNITVHGMDRPGKPVIDGPKTGEVNEKLHFQVSSTDPNDDKVKYMVNWGDGGISNWTDFGESGWKATFSHVYKEPGQYTIKVLVRDVDHHPLYNPMESENTYTVTIKKEENKPPSKPVITGPTEVEKGKGYYYTFVSTDPNNDKVEYYIEFGDEVYSNGWVGPLNSGEPLEIYYEWYQDYGDHIIRAKARDEKGAESEWATLKVTVPKNKKEMSKASAYLLLGLLRQYSELMKTQWITSPCLL
jgi:cytochrome oxidase Cu insertion factor (SCO1/SenC/PrrC family)